MENGTSGTASFLRLPPELRIQVYEELRLLTPSGDIYLLDDELFLGHFLATFHTSVLLTNRQIHEEARKVFYKENTLVLWVVSQPWPSDEPVRLRKVTPLSALTNVQEARLIFAPHRSITQMAYNAPKDGEQVVLVHRAEQMCNMLSKLPALRWVKVLAPCCHEFQPYEDVQEIESQLLLHRLTAALEPLMSLPLKVTIQGFDPLNHKEMPCQRRVPLVLQTFARCVDVVISARARLREEGKASFDSLNRKMARMSSIQMNTVTDLHHLD